MVNITGLSLSEKAEFAGYIRQDTLEEVNRQVQLVPVKNSFYTRYGKRMLDVIIALFALAVTLPINLVIAVVTFFDVGKPILFRQKRIGKDKRTFTIYKFRNMTNAVDANGELLPPGERVTKWGRFVRRTSLDELLNFISVLRGDMSIVGPRPLLDTYLDRFNKRDLQRYCVRPGLECPPYKRLNHPLTWDEKLANDVWYVQNCSLKVDIVLLYRIAQLALDRKSTAIRSAAGIGGFLGYQKDGTVISTQAVPEKYCEMFCQTHGYASMDEAFQHADDSKKRTVGAE